MGFKLKEQVFPYKGGIIAVLCLVAAIERLRTFSRLLPQLAVVSVRIHPPFNVFRRWPWEFIAVRIFLFSYSLKHHEPHEVL